MNALALYVLLGFLIGFPLLWMGIIFLMSRACGWASLATVYRAKREPDGQRFSGQSLGMGYFSILMGSYGNCVTAHLSETHLYLKPWPIFALGHPRLALPLKDMTATQKKVLFFDVTELTLRQQSAVKIRVFKRLANQLNAQLRAEAEV